MGTVEGGRIRVPPPVAMYISWITLTFRAMKQVTLVPDALGFVEKTHQAPSFKEYTSELLLTCGGPAFRPEFWDAHCQ